MSDAGGNPREGKTEGESAVYINIKVKDQNENEVFFKIKRNTKLSKVFNAYCQRQSIERGSVRFTFDGTRLANEDTPGSLEMEEGDKIDCFLEQLGGDRTPEPTSKININIRDVNNDVAAFKMRHNQKLTHLFVTFARNRSVSRDGLQFFAYGRPGFDDDTPASLGLREEDTLTVIGIPSRRMPQAATESDRIIVIIKEEEEEEEGKAFPQKIARWQNLEALMNTHDSKSFIDVHDQLYVFNGQRVMRRGTADSIGLGAGDVIKARRIGDRSDFQ